MSTETFRFKDNFKIMFYSLVVLDKILLAKCWNEFIKIRKYDQEGDDACVDSKDCIFQSC